MALTGEIATILTVEQGLTLPSRITHFDTCIQKNGGEFPSGFSSVKAVKKERTVQLSTLRRAMNFFIAPIFYTTSLQSVMRMLAGEQRKTLFIGRDQVEG
jgi:hypothetical protein